MFATCHFECCLRFLWTPFPSRVLLQRQQPQLPAFHSLCSPWIGVCYAFSLFSWYRHAPLTFSSASRFTHPRSMECLLILSFLLFPLFFLRTPGGPSCVGFFYSLPRSFVVPGEGLCLANALPSPLLPLVLPGCCGFLCVRQPPAFLWLDFAWKTVGCVCLRVCHSISRT